MSMRSQIFAFALWLSLGFIFSLIFGLPFILVDGVNKIWVKYVTKNKSILLWILYICLPSFTVSCLILLGFAKLINFLKSKTPKSKRKAIDKIHDNIVALYSSVYNANYTFYNTENLRAVYTKYLTIMKEDVSRVVIQNRITFLLTMISKINANEFFTEASKFEVNRAISETLNLFNKILSEIDDVKVKAIQKDDDLYVEKLKTFSLETRSMIDDFNKPSKEMVSLGSDESWMSQELRDKLKSYTES